MKIQKASEDYLESMLMMKEQHGYIRSVDVADHLGVTKPSVTYATKQLKQNGFITMDRDGLITLTESGKIVLVRQYRTAIDRVTVEIPAGKLDPGEDPLDCAKRELHEETGFRAGRIRFLTSIVTSCGFCDEIIHIYLATKLEFDAPNPDDDEFVNVDLVPLHELIDAVLDGKIEDAKTVVGALACDSIAHRLGGTEL